MIVTAPTGVAAINAGGVTLHSFFQLLFGPYLPGSEGQQQSNQRSYRHKQLPFGGVQLLIIGDLHQLAPVVKEDEWNLLIAHYDPCYFFSSHALRQAQMVTIELKTLYRHSSSNY